MANLIVFTDLDGTLLDHDTYSYDEARPGLDRLAAEGVPLVLVSSKTRPEIEELRARLGARHPFVPENGGAIFIPRDYDLDVPREAEIIGDYRVILLGRSRSEIAPLFDRLAAKFPVRALSRLDPREIVALTGLTLDQARQAAAREFGEAFVLDDPSIPEPELAAAAAELGLRLTSGGRFHHLLAENDKGRAVRILIELYKKRRPGLVSAAVGDAPNDRPMLAEVDRPFLVARKDGTHHQVDVPGLVKIDEPGPAGFSKAVLSLFS
jgi:mannosyl-3-phosphoglycerate phosphatase